MSHQQPTVGVPLGEGGGERDTLHWGRGEGHITLGGWLLEVYRVFHNFGDAQGRIAIRITIYYIILSSEIGQTAIFASLILPSVCFRPKRFHTLA